MRLIWTLQLFALSTFKTQPPWLFSAIIIHFLQKYKCSSLHDDTLFSIMNDDLVVSPVCTYVLYIRWCLVCGLQPDCSISAITPLPVKLLPSQLCSFPTDLMWPCACQCISSLNLPVLFRTSLVVQICSSNSHSLNHSLNQAHSAPSFLSILVRPYVRTRCNQQWYGS